MKTLFLCIIVVLIASACSHRGGYENVRQNHLQQCDAMPESARRECIEQATGPYDAYEQDRKALIDSGKSTSTK